MRRQETKSILEKRGEVETAEMSVDQGRTAGANGADSRNEAL
jgi:hypothetical protein